MQALGFIETRGLVTATEAADSALKAAEVSLVTRKQPGTGLVAVIVTGEVAAVKAAVEAGAESAATVGEVITVQVIARPHKDMELFIFGEPAKKDETKTQKTPAKAKASPAEKKRKPGV